MTHTFRVWLPTEENVMWFVLGVAFTILVILVVGKVLEYFDIL